MSTRLVIRLVLLAVVVLLLFQRCHRSATAQTAELKVGVPVKTEIAGGNTATFAMHLLANQYVRVNIDHYGFDALVSVIAPDGKSIREIEGQNDNSFGTGFAFLTTSAGTYQLVLKSNDKETAAKPFTANLHEARPQTASDAAQLALDRQIDEANRERNKRTPEARRAALKLYGDVLASAQTNGDRDNESTALYEMARTHNDLGEREKARDYHLKALAIRRELKNQRTIAASLHALGNLSGNLGDVPNAVKYFDETLAIRRATNDQRGVLAALNGLGQLWANRGDFKKATGYYEQVQQVAHETNDKRSEAEALFGLGRFARQQGQPQKALEFYQQALPLFQSINHRLGEASTLQAIGVAYLVSNQKEKALENLQRALELAREVKNSGLQANILNPLADAYEANGEMRKAIETYDEAIALARETGNQRVEGSILNNLALLYLNLGERQKALELYQRALPLVQKFGGPRGAAPQLKGIAITYNELGEKQQALDYFQQALDTARTLNDPVFQAATLGDVGAVLNSLGDRERGLARLQEGLAIAEKVKMPGLEADLLLNKGWMLFSSNDKEEALKQFETVQARSGVAPGVQISALNGAALCHDHAERYEQAEKLLQSALELSRKIGSRSGEASSLHNLGWTAYRRQNPDAAREYFSQALKAKREVSDKGGEAATLFALAKLDHEAGALDAARAQIESALDIVETLRTKVASQELRTSYFAMLRRYYDLYLDVLMELDKQHQGENYSAQALQASERARARSLLDMLAEARADIRQGVNPALVKRERELQDLLNGKADALFQARQRKGSDAQATVILKDIDSLSSELQQLRVTIRQQNPRYAELTQPKPLSVQELQTQVLDDDTLLLEYALGEERSYLWAVTPKALRSYVLPKRADIEAAAQKVVELLTVRNQAQRQLTAAKGQTLPRLSPAAADAQYWRAARQLSQMILQPVASQLGRKRLVIVAEGALQYVPFGALPVVGYRLPVAGKKSLANRQPTTDNRQPLIVNHEIINLPSASSLGVLREEVKGREVAPRMIAVFADPVFDAADERLKAATKSAETAKTETTEIRAVQEAQPEKTVDAVAAGLAAETTRKLIVSKLGDAEGVGLQRLKFTRNEAERILLAANKNDSFSALDFAARRSALFDGNLDQYRILHFATHGLLDTERPELSALIFSLVNEKGETQDGFLRAHEIYNLNLAADLVVLSACETGLGKQVRGEGLVGLTRGFMYAGAPRVVVSLWSVSDRGTSELMAKFYRKLLKENARPAAALRAAQIEMWQSGQWRSPYYWAAFTLQGEWR